MAALPGIDLEAVARFLDRPSVEASLVTGGRSNLTYLLDAGEHRWVLRRPPLGHVLETAHDMRREYRVMSALADSAVPVPRTIAFCADEDVIGAPFFVMDRVDGLTVRETDDLDRLPSDAAAALGEALVDVLAALHSVDVEAVGLSDFGRPDGFLQRQVRRWGKQLAASRSRDLPGADRLHDRLAASVPVTQRAAIVHGDYRIDNVIVDPERPDAPIRALLDWEMSTLGDPLTDLGLLVLYWDGIRGIAPRLEGRPEFLGKREMVARYSERTGLSIQDLDWYVAFAHYKFVAIMEGIHYRYEHGETVGDGFENIGEQVPPLIESGLAVLDEGVS